MFDGIPADLFNGVGVVGICVLGAAWFILALSKGKLCTGRELREKDKRIDALEAMVRTRDHQLTLVLTEAMTTINPVLRAMRTAVESDEASP